jgi:flagellar basal body rod protein FlgB
MPTQLIDPVLEGLARALDVQQRRQGLADPGTPGVRGQDVDFAAALARAFDRTAPAESADLALARIFDMRIALMRLAIDGGK